VSTILHLSDLHLGAGDAWERRTDDKSGIIPAAENSRLAVITSTLRSIKASLESKGETLDAVIVSGDVTSRNDASGFERFRELVREVDLAPNGDIVVVPGNHDVDWASDPGTPAKYATFLRHTRDHGMRTPLCDGVDADDFATRAPPAHPVLWLPDAVIVAVNTANWCGTRLASGVKSSRPRRWLTRKLAGAPALTYDAARVSEPQLQRLTDALRAHPIGERLRIAVLHHHLLPVTEDEEVKPFESFTNLARLRGWLRQHGFQVVLHGHKHRSVVTWDHVYDLDDPRLQPRRVAIISAPTPTSWGVPLCRLLRVGDATGRAAVPGAPRIVLDTIHAERHERPLHIQSTPVALDPGRPTTPGFLAIEGETADAVYEQLVDALDAHGGKLLNVTCVVRDPNSATQPPTSFKRLDKLKRVENPAEWLSDAVAWWQKASPVLVSVGRAPFNHGERLYSTGNTIGSLDIAAQKLGSTKALALILRESELRSGAEAPAFVAVQLVKVPDGPNERLDCVGYFRKQDLTLWWPVNIGELRAIQQYVLNLESSKGLIAGRLVTIAAEANRDNVLPELAGTTVDRWVDLRPEVLMRMAYLAAHRTDTTPDDIARLWKSVLRDIRDGNDFPSLGIRRLIEHLQVFREVGELTHLDEVIKRLQAVYDRADRARRSAKTNSDRDRFSAELFEQVGEVLDAVDDAGQANP